MTDAVPTIPVIDISPLLTNAPGGREAVAAEIGRACREVGFFYIAGHGFSPERLQELFEVNRILFDLPEEEKKKLSIEQSMHNRGFVLLGAEALDPTKGADLKEAFNIGADLAADDPDVLAGKPFRGVNLWPDLPEVKATLLAYHADLRKLCERLHEAFAVDLGLAPDFFQSSIDDPIATLRLLHYPAQAAGGAEIGAGTHTDYGNTTILLQDDVGGLEVRTRQGTWLPAPVIPNTFICNIGDSLMRWTNRVYVSTPHRVVNRSGRQRRSIAFFFDGNPDAVIECAPTCTGPDKPVRYPPITVADYLTERLNATYAFRQKAG